MAGESRETPEAGAAGKTFTEAELASAIAERDRAWQARLTRGQQDAADLRRHLAETESRFEERLQGFERRFTERPEPKREREVIDWNGIDSGDKLRDAAARLVDEAVEARLAKSRSGEELQAIANEVEALKLDRELTGLRGTYRGLTNDDERRVIEYATKHGDCDLEFAAWKALGTPEAFAAKTNGDGDAVDEDKLRSRTQAAILSGRARAQAQDASPKIVKVRRGAAGYEDAERAAVDWAKNRR